MAGPLANRVDQPQEREHLPADRGIGLEGEPVKLQRQTFGGFPHCHITKPRFVAIEPLAIDFHMGMPMRVRLAVGSSSPAASHGGEGERGAGRGAAPA